MRASQLTICTLVLFCACRFTDLLAIAGVVLVQYHVWWWFHFWALPYSGEVRCCAALSAAALTLLLFLRQPHARTH
jgi:hypothetical protein